MVDPVLFPLLCQSIRQFRYQNTVYILATDRTMRGNQVQVILLAKTTITYMLTWRASRFRDQSGYHQIRVPTCRQTHCLQAARLVMV